MSGKEFSEEYNMISSVLSSKIYKIGKETKEL